MRRGTLINGTSQIRGATPAHICTKQFFSVGPGVFATSGEHPLRTASTFKSRNGALREVFSTVPSRTARIEIGPDVWIGAGVTVLAGVSIGTGAVLAAGCVVTKDVPPYTVAGGVPARTLKERFPPHVRDWLLRLRWWEWRDEQILENTSFFQVTLENCSPAELEQVERTLRL